MSFDKQKIDQVTNVLDGTEQTQAYTMEVELTSRRVGGPDPRATVEQLERNLDIARARLIYANMQKTQWITECQKRNQDFEHALLAYVSKKQNITEDDLAKKMDCNHLGLFDVGEKR